MAASSAPKPFDLVVYGASGFTGQYVVEEVARVQEQEKGAFLYIFLSNNITFLSSREVFFSGLNYS